MRMAYFTPLMPQHSGISDHSEEWLPYLQPHADIDVVTSGSYTPTNREFCERFRVIDYREYLRAPGVYDAAVYQIGNNLLHHAYMVPCMRAAPGIVALQDYSLQYLVLGLTLKQGELNAAADALRPVYGDDTRSLVYKLLFGAVDPAGLSFAHPFLEASRGVIVHSDHLLDLVREQVPDKPIRNVPLGITMPKFDESIESLRRRYGYGKDDFIIASVSTRAPKKRLDVVLEAIHRVRAEIPNIRFLIVGGGSPGKKIHRLIRQYELTEIVTQTGWVDPQQYQDLVHLADVGVDLRDMAAAENAHSALRCIASGVPIIVSASGTFLELPDGCCPKLVADENQAAALGDLLREYQRQPQKLERMKQFAIDYARERLSLELQAREFLAYVEELVDSTPGTGSVELLETSRSLTSPIYAALYSVFRAGFLLRRYGAADSLRRLRANLANRLVSNRPETL